MASAIEFRNALTRYKAERMPAIARAINTEFIKRLATGVVMRTPVRTGLARGNWRLAIGATRGQFPIPFLDPDGVFTVARVTAQAERAALYSKFTLYNQVPYIKYLEEGSSLQAPLGMMRVTLDELKVNWRAAVKAAGGRLRGQFIVR